MRVGGDWRVGGLGDWFVGGEEGEDGGGIGHIGEEGLKMKMRRALSTKM